MYCRVNFLERWARNADRPSPARRYCIFAASFSVTDTSGWLARVDGIVDPPRIGFCLILAHSGHPTSFPVTLSSRPSPSHAVNNRKRGSAVVAKTASFSPLSCPEFSLPNRTQSRLQPNTCTVNTCGRSLRIDKVRLHINIFRPHRLHVVHRCSRLLQLSHTRFCLSVSLCVGNR